MRRINIRRIAIALVLGAIINVLVAWAFDRIYSSNSVPWTTTGLAWPIDVPAGWPSAPMQGGTRYGFGATWMQLISMPTIARAHLTYCVNGVQIGWPWPALAKYAAEITTDLTMTREDLGTFRSGMPWPKRWPTAKIGQEDRLPIFPLWPGFAINTLFYGTFAWAMMAGVSYFKHRRRAKPGMCVACGYPVSGLNVCPECGTHVGSVTAM